MSSSFAPLHSNIYSGEEKFEWDVEWSYMFPNVEKEQSNWQCWRFCFLCSLSANLAHLFYPCWSITVPYYGHLPKVRSSIDTDSDKNWGKHPTRYFRSDLLLKTVIAICVVFSEGIENAELRRESSTDDISSMEDLWLQVVFTYISWVLSQC